MPVGYIISGDYQNEANLQMVVDARSEVGGVYLYFSLMKRRMYEYRN